MGERRTRHVVVVGYGMAGARLVEEIRRRDPDGARVRLTVLGAEPEPAYNRVLLAGVLAGTLQPDQIGLHAGDWPWRHRVGVQLGRPVHAIDPMRRRVRTVDGWTAGYDDLVLATGSRARLPGLPGLVGPDGGPGAGVAVLRELADCRRLHQLTGGGDPVLVLGGGVLGLEAARALAARGLPVTLLHPRGHLMNRQLDAEGGRLLARTVRRHGLRVRLGEAARCWRPGRGLTTERGELLPAGTVLVSAGMVAETGLARDAGLAVDRGVLVDDRLATSAPHVYALGDCARHPAAVAGFVQPAWDQAAVLADLLTGADPAARYRGTRAVTRLKDNQIELATVGDPQLSDVDESDVDNAGAEVLRFSDPARGRYAKLVLRGDRVAGAIMLGVPDAAATVVQLYDRDAPVPTDRVALLLGRAAGTGTGPATAGTAAADLPTDAVVCRCNTVTKAQLVTAWRAGATGTAALASATRATTGCGGCRSLVDSLRQWLAGRAGSTPDQPDTEVVA